MKNKTKKCYIECYTKCCTQMWQNILLRKSRAEKMWLQLKESQPGGKSTHAKSHALKKIRNLIVNVLAYH